MKDYKELHDPIIFIGSGRSGTTIISEIIMRHPDLAYPSNYQEKYYKFSNVNTIRLIFDNKFWRLYGQKKQLNKVNILNAYYFRPAESYKMWNYLVGEDIDFSKNFLVDKSLNEKRVQFIREYFYKMVKYQNRKRLVFKITGPSRISFLTKIFPDAIFINLKRKRIPTISSFLNVNFWKTRGRYKLWWTGVYSEEEKEWAIKKSKNALLLTAFQLKKIDDITQIEIDKIQPKYMEVNYEDFVANPENEIKRIIKYTNLKPYNYKKHLEGIKIYNRNKKDCEYFTKSELKDINRILLKEI